VVLPEHPLLPHVVERLDDGIAARLAGWHEQQVRADQQVESGHGGETEPVPPATRRGHLVVELRHLRHAEPPPGPHEVRTEGLARLVPVLRRPDAAADESDGVNRVEPDRAAAPTQMPGPHQVRLLQIARFRRAGPRVGHRAGHPSTRAAAIPMRAQDPLDRADAGNHPSALVAQELLNVDRPHAAEACPWRLVCLELDAKRDDPGSQGRRHRPANAVRPPAPVQQTVARVCPRATEPLGEPRARPAQSPANLRVAHAVAMPSNRLLPSLKLVVAVPHDALLSATGRHRPSTSYWLTMC